MSRSLGEKMVKMFTLYVLLALIIFPHAVLAGGDFPDQAIAAMLLALKKSQQQEKYISVDDTILLLLAQWGINSIQQGVQSLVPDSHGISELAAELVDDPEPDLLVPEFQHNQEDVQNSARVSEVACELSLNGTCARSVLTQDELKIESAEMPAESNSRRTDRESREKQREENRRTREAKKRARAAEMVQKDKKEQEQKKAEQTFSIQLTPNAQNNLDQLKRDPAKKAVVLAVNKTIALMEVNLRHPSLTTHPFSCDHGKRIFESYVQNNTPGAYRMYWYYGPGNNDISIVSIVPHPK